jgi:hypothetical protein
MAGEDVRSCGKGTERKANLAYSRSVKHALRFLFLSSLGDAFQRVNADIQLKTDQQDE